jgi:hypothetical protein
MSVDRVQQCTICFMNVDGVNGYLRHIRKVHGNDRLFGTYCPLCDSKFLFTNLKSFIHHFRKHVLHSSSDKETTSSLILNHDEINITSNDENEQQQSLCDNEQQQSVCEYEQHNAVEEIKKFYVKMLLKLREGHTLPGNVMKTVALSISCLIQTFSYHLLSKLNMNVDGVVSCNFNDDIEKAFFEVSRNENSFISSCQLYFKFVKPKEIQLSTGNKAYYIPIRDVLMNLFEKHDFYECIKQEKEYIAQFDGQDILYHYRNAEIGQQHYVLNNKNNCLLLQLYSDDLGVVNPLMGKNATHKLTTFYFSIDDLPARHSSSLNAVYLLLLYYTKDFADENNRRIIFSQFNRDLKSLEQDGLILPGDTTSTYFTISTLCADNLAGDCFHKILDKKRLILEIF